MSTIEEMLDDKTTNRLIISGQIIDEPKFSHKIRGVRYFKTRINVVRLSKNSDILPIIVSEKLSKGITAGNYVKLQGSLRSYDIFINGGRNKLKIYIYVQSIELQSEHNMKNINEIYLKGFLCNPPVYRITPLNRQICNLLLAVNRSYGKSDYIPCITWGKSARYMYRKDIGMYLCVKGRIQSRDYLKLLENGEQQKRTAYEVSVAEFVELNYEE